jgi:ribonuclease-3 family protein
MNFLNQLLTRIGDAATDPAEMSPLALAFIGDAVYDLFIRSYLVFGNKQKPHELHLSAVNYVRAETQAQVVHGLFSILSESELEIVRRGRNAKPSTMPKHAGFMEYRYSTGFEALLGYLYLTHQHDRLDEILFASIDIAEGIEGSPR